MGSATGVRAEGQLFRAFYHQYRLWPGEHVTPCLETMTPATGKSHSYPIARNTLYRAYPEFRTYADQSVVWLVDNPGASIKYGVWCSLNRITGEFVGQGASIRTVSARPAASRRRDEGVYGGNSLAMSRRPPLILPSIPGAMTEAFFNRAMTCAGVSSGSWDKSVAAARRDDRRRRSLCPVP